MYFCNSVSNNLLQKPIIRTFLSVLLLLVFAFGMTPKIALHYLTAHHKDTHFLTTNGNTDQLNIAGFHCDCDNQVVESPFLDYSINIPVEAPVALSIHPIPDYQTFHSGEHLIFGLRGPPSPIASI